MSTCPEDRELEAEAQDQGSANRLINATEPESCSKTWWSEIKREKKKTTDNFPFLLLLLVVWVLTSSGKL